jgi:hypothetical protein
VATCDQIVRVGLTLLSHQMRSAATTTTNKIINFIWLLPFHHSKAAGDNGAKTGGFALAPQTII